MDEAGTEPVRDRLEEVGTDLAFAARFTADDAAVIAGEDRFQEFVAESESRTVSDMHRDALSRREQAEVGGELYGLTVRAEAQVTDRGTGVYFYPEGEAGYFVMFEPGGTVELPTFVDEFVDALGAAN